MIHSNILTLRMSKCFLSIHQHSTYDVCNTTGAPGVLGIWEEWLFIFRELGSTGNYFRGAREQAHNFGDIKSLVKKKKIIRKSLHFD